MFTIVWAGARFRVIRVRECWLVDDGSSFIDLIFDLGMFNCSNEGLVVYRGGLIRVTFVADMIEGWGRTVHSIVVSWVKRHVRILFSLHLPKSVWFLHGLDHTDVWRVGFEESAVKGLELTFCAVCTPKGRLPHRSNDRPHGPRKLQVGSWIALSISLLPTYNLHFGETNDTLKRFEPRQTCQVLSATPGRLLGPWVLYEKWALWLAWPLASFACWNGLSMFAAVKHFDISEYCQIVAT